MVAQKVTKVVFSLKVTCLKVLEKVEGICANLKRKFVAIKLKYRPIWPHWMTTQDSGSILVMKKIIEQLLIH